MHTHPHLYIAFNTVAGKFWSGSAFDAEEIGAEILTSADLAVVRATYENVESRVILNRNPWVNKLLSERDGARHALASEKEAHASSWRKQQQNINWLRKVLDDYESADERRHKAGLA